jgi:hypothetical protein
MLLVGCGCDPVHGVLKRAEVEGADVAEALGARLHRFNLTLYRRVHGVRIWAELHRPSEPDPVIQELGRWTGHGIGGDVVLKPPSENFPEFFCAVGNDAIRKPVDETVGPDSENGPFVSILGKTTLRLGSPVTLAVYVYGDETRGASSDSLDEYVQANLRHGTCQRIVAYRIAFLPEP